MQIFKGFLFFATGALLSEAMAVGATGSGSGSVRPINPFYFTP